MARKYTREFKISAVKLVNEQGYSISQAAKSLGVDAANVRFCPPANNASCTRGEP